MLDLQKHKQKAAISVVGIITMVGEVKEIPSQNGTFQVQEFAMEYFYGKPDYPYVETLVFQATSRTTRRWDKNANDYVDAPSFIDQFKEKPLQVGEVVSAKCSISGYVNTKFTIPKVILESLWRLKDDDKSTIQLLIEVARQNRAAK